MQSSAEELTKYALQPAHYTYFDQSGQNLGESYGDTPQADLYSTAHYVVVNQEEMIKNNDSKDQIATDLKTCEHTLLQTPISNIGEIMYLNRLIKALRKCLNG